MHLVPRRTLSLSSLQRCAAFCRLYSQDIQTSTPLSLVVDFVEGKSGRQQNRRSEGDAALSPWPGWNLVIGIEAHAQLKTRRKLFSGTVFGL